MMASRPLQTATLPSLRTCAVKVREQAIRCETVGGARLGGEVDEVEVLRLYSFLPG